MHVIDPELLKRNLAHIPVSYEATVYFWGVPVKAPVGQWCSSALGRIEQLEKSLADHVREVGLNTLTGTSREEMLKLKEQLVKKEEQIRVQAQNVGFYSARADQMQAERNEAQQRVRILEVEKATRAAGQIGSPYRWADELARQLGYPPEDRCAADTARTVRLKERNLELEKALACRLEIISDRDSELTGLRDANRRLRLDLENLKRTKAPIVPESFMGFRVQMHKGGLACNDYITCMNDRGKIVGKIEIDR